MAEDHNTQRATLVTVDLGVLRAPRGDSADMRRGVLFQVSGGATATQCDLLRRLIDESIHFVPPLCEGTEVLGSRYTFAVLLRNWQGAEIAAGALQELIDLARLEDESFPFLSITIVGFRALSEDLRKASGNDINMIKLTKDGNLVYPEVSSGKHLSIADYAVEIRSILQEQETTDLIELLSEPAPTPANESLVRSANAAQHLGRAALLSLLVERLRSDLNESVENSRMSGASWSEIGKATGISQQAAWRRWDPTAKKKHADYNRNQRSGE